MLQKFCAKIRRETRKEELETASACQSNMRSREPYVARASEDERKERLHDRAEKQLRMSSIRAGKP